jgi:hypothetical protein
VKGESIERVAELARPEALHIAIVGGSPERWWDVFTDEKARHVVVWWKIHYLADARLGERSEGLWAAVDPAARRDHVMVLSDSLMSTWTEEVRARSSQIWRGPAGEGQAPFWRPSSCVTAALRIAGIPETALRPRALGRLLSRRGWTLVWDRDEQAAAA